MDKQQFKERWNLTDEVANDIENYLRTQMGGWWELHCVFLRCTQPLGDTLKEVINSIVVEEGQT